MPSDTDHRRRSPAPLADTIADVIDQVSYRRVSLGDLSDPVYKLRYEAYRREDFIPINSQLVLEDEWDLAPNAHCYGIYIGEKLVSSVRIHHAANTGSISPSRTLWPEELGAFLEAGKTYIDPTRFTADYEASLAYPILPFLTLRIAVMASDYYDVDYCIGAVRREHGAFYRRVFRSVQMGGERHYPGLTFPMFLYVADVPATLAELYLRYPVFMSTPAEREALFGGTGPATPVRATTLLALRDALEAAPGD